MLKNYLKIAWRNLIRNGVFSLINIVGLAIGLACSILILIWVQDELSFDLFHTKHKRIYQVLQDMPFTEKTTWAVTQGPLAKSLADEVPEIAHAVSLTSDTWRFRIEDNEYREPIIYTDRAFFDIFSFQILRGNLETMFSDPNAVIITEKIANNYFGENEALGNTMKVWDKYEVKVTGIMKDLPSNSHLKFKMIAPLALAKSFGYSVDRWNNSGFYTYLLASENTTIETVKEKIRDHLDDKPTLEEGAKLHVQPLADIHLSSGIDFNNGGKGNVLYVIIFFTSAIFILVIACINFMNLSTAQATNRAKEVGLRKTIGARRGQLIKQFFMESIVLAVIAFSISLLLVELILPTFNTFSGKLLDVAYFNLHNILGFILLMIITGVIAGFYPAFFLSSFQPITSLKGQVSRHSKGTGFRKALVIIQCSISIILLIGTFAVHKQVSYLSDKDIGYNTDHLLYINLNNEVLNHLDAAKTEFLRHENVVAATSSATLSSYWFSNNKWSWPGKTPEQDILFRATFVDYDYFETFEMEMADGRTFSRDFPGDTLGVVLNQTAVDMMDLENPVGEILTPANRNPLNIVGVVKDFNFRSLHTEIEPLILILVPEMSNYLWLRIKAEHVKETLKLIESTWKKVSPDHEFSFGFLDQRMESQYTAEKRIGIILDAFSVLAILVLSLGTFGLLGFSVRQRFKEISIRKVFGASNTLILMLLAKDYAKLLLIAIVIAIPIANYFVKEWLGGFPYTIDISPYIFILPAMILVIISGLIILGQSYSATKINPAETLRNE